MSWFSKNRKPDPGALPPNEPKPSQDTVLTTDSKTKDPASPTVSSPLSARLPDTPILPHRTTYTTKPAPTRTASTTIKEPSELPTRSGTNARPTRKSSATSKKPERPTLQRQRTMAETRYIKMLLQLDQISKLHNVLASLFTWILLAGYIVFPATFNNIKKNGDLDDKANNELKKHALTAVRNVPLLYIASFACGIGVLGCVWLWWKYRNNYVWVINRILLPALMNSIAGLISTIVNIYSAQDGQYSVTAKATIIVTSACTVVTAALFLLYNSVMLTIVKKRHDKEVQAVERSQSQRDILSAQEEKGGMLGAVGADTGRIV